MRKYLLPEWGNFYKANLHMHTSVSDGVTSPEDVKAAYKSRGYSVVAFTDHEILVPQNELTDDEFLAINAVELAINDNFPGGFNYNKSYHLNLYAKSKDIKECSVCTGKTLWSSIEHMKQYASQATLDNPYRKFHSVDGINDLIERANNDGFLVCYNHPLWSLHNYPDYSGLKGLWGVEVYNTGCARGGLEDTTQPFSDLLNQNERIVPIAADDAHSLGASAFGGWTMIKAEKLEYETVISALERGDCYSSTGPEIKELYIEDGVVHFKTSEVVFATLLTDIRYGKNKHGSEESPITEVAFDINDFIKSERECKVCRRTKPYFRIEVKDKHGKRAFSRAYFLDELGE